MPIWRIAGRSPKISGQMSTPGAVPVVGQVSPPTPEAAVAPAAVPSGPRTHVVGKGDTLGKLAGKYYGKTSQWEKILAANPQLGKDGKKLALGMKLTIPE